MLLGTNCQPFFVAVAAPQGHLVRQESRGTSVQLLSAAQRYNTLDFAEQSRVPRNPGAVSLDSSGYRVAHWFQAIADAGVNSYTWSN